MYGVFFFLDLYEGRGLSTMGSASQQAIWAKGNRSDFKDASTISTISPTMMRKRGYEHSSSSDGKETIHLSLDLL